MLKAEGDTTFSKAGPIFQLSFWEQWECPWLSEFTKDILIKTAANQEENRNKVIKAQQSSTQSRRWEKVWD